MKRSRSLRSLTRRGFHRLATMVAAATAAGCSEDELHFLDERGYLLPPPSAREQTTACAYCIVACGYKAYTWPVGGESGGLEAENNAFGVNFPVAPMSGYGITPQMYNIAMVDGEPHHVIVMPDPDATVVNIGGDHNLGASMAQRFYSPEKATSDRLLSPKLRVGGELVDISWDEATEILARVGTHVQEQHGPAAWALKTFSYQFFENTYAITKFAFDALKTPCWAPHDQPASGSSTPGLSDIGVNAFSAAYSDWKESDVLFVSGVSLYEARGVLFSQWVAGGPTLIVVNPRRDETAEYALENGGMHLQVTPGTDALLHNAIAFAILENGWQDDYFIEGQTVDDDELAIEGEQSARRRRFGRTFEAFREFILGNDEHAPERAAAVTGVPAEDIRRAAELLARPVKRARPKASFMLEKGNYWSHNYANSASLASLGVLVGAGNRPGQVISRGGGHQRGMLKAAGYPLDNSPVEVDGEKRPVNLDYWLLEGNVRLAWVIGCTWVTGGSAHTEALTAQVKAQARGSEFSQLDEDTAFSGGSLNLPAVVERLTAKIDQGGLVFVQQDIYPQEQTELADLVLPACTWGEAPFVRMQGERRLRHYAHIVDAPGEVRPDWKIIAEVARRMGFEGFDWSDENEIFEEGAARSEGKANDYSHLVALANETNQRAHDLLAQFGTTGLQCPIQRDGDQLSGTTRLHEEGFATQTGKSMFLAVDYNELVVSREDIFSPVGQELQIINRRVGGNWSSLVEDLRNDYRASLLPENVLEINPSDASARGIEDRDPVRVSAGSLQHCAGAQVDVPGGSFEAIAVLSDTVAPGVACAYFNFRGESSTSSNAVIPNSADPVSGLFSFKLGRGTVTKRLPKKVFDERA